MSTAVVERTEAAPKPSLMQSFASKFSVEPGKMMDTLRATCFKGGRDRPVSNEQMLALVAVANEYNLNPFLKEIYAFPDKMGGIVPVVGIDGWIRIVNSNAVFDGEEFEYGPAIESGPHKGKPAWIQCTMYRKDRSRPTLIREYFTECYRNTDPWNGTGSRMLRHRAYIQCARVCFGLGGIYDPDEGESIIEGAVRVVDSKPADAIDNLNKRIASRNTVDVQNVSDEASTSIDNDTGEIVATSDQQGDSDQASQTSDEPDDQPNVTYADVMDKAAKAKTLEELEIVGGMVKGLPKDQQQDASNEIGRRYQQIKGK